MIKIVFDMGATNTRVAMVEGIVLAGILKKSTPEDRNAWPEHLKSLIEEVSDGENVESIVGGAAGIRGREALTSAFPEADIYNDALLAGLGEAVQGAGKDKNIVGYIGLGTGIGTARITGKKLDVRGFEAGHHIVDVSNNESWEEKISGRLIKEKYGKCPQELDREVYEDYVKKIAIGVYNAVLFWSPEIVVVGGALISEKESFKIEEIAAAVSDINEALPALPPIVKSELGDNAGLYGAMTIIENELKAG